MECNAWRGFVLDPFIMPATKPSRCSDDVSLATCPTQDIGSVHEVSINSPKDVYACGPWRAWSTLIGAWLVQFCAVGFMSAFGVMQTYYSQGFLDNMSPSAISWIGSVQLFLDLALAAPGGDLLDKGYFRHTVVAGSVIFVICHFMLSLVSPHQYYQVFLAQGLGMGIGIGLVYLSTSVIVTQHFKQNKSLAMGVVMSGGSLGGFVFSVALNYLLHSSMTFGWTMRLSAFFCLGLLFLGNLLMFEPHPSKDNLARTDQADTSSIIDEKVLGKIRQDSIQTTNLNDQSTRQGSIYDAKYLCFLGMGFLTGLGKWFPTYYVQLFAEQHGVSQQLSFYALAVMNISNMLGRIFPNWLGDRWSPFDVYMVCLLCAGGVEFSMLACSTSYGLILFIIIYGFFLGTSISLYLPAVASLSNEKAREGKRMGLALVPVGVSSLIGTPISGAILGPDYDWWKGVVFSSITMLAGAILMCSIRLPSVLSTRRRNSPT